MTARSDVPTAYQLSQQLDAINSALAGLAADYTVQGIFLRSPSGGGFSVELPLGTNAVTTVLTNRKAAITQQLAALGVT